MPFASPTDYAGTARGAEWNRWDLHVHTPASYEQYFGDGAQQETWDRYIAALANLPREIRAIGINDYFSIDGYRRVLEARELGLLPNLKLILPVIELRLTSFVGSDETGKLNFHVLFSDAVSPDQIEQFFLRQLIVELKLDGGQPWQGCLGTREGLIDLGKSVRRATPDGIRSNHSELEAGFGNAAVDFPVVIQAIEQSVFQNRVLTAIGAGEWGQMRWRGAGTAQKRNAIERADFVLTAAPSLKRYHEHRQGLVADGVNSRLIDASDAHYYLESDQPNRLGQGQTWIKADLSFQGLRRALARFEDRVFVGAMPPKLERVRQNKTKYIDRLVIHKKAGSSLSEEWFDADIPLNHDLVAVIGNQGSGKSALTDILALCGQTHVEEFSFLTSEKFRDKQKRASHFLATLSWSDTQCKTTPLDEGPDRTLTERVRYVPQGFFDAVTNETAVSEGGKFYSEIKKAIFSHVPTAQRLQSSSLDALLSLHTRAADEQLGQLRAELSEINRRAEAIEASCAVSEVTKTEARIKQLEEQIAALQSNPPTEVAAPTESAVASGQIKSLLKDEELLRSQIANAEETQGRLRRQRTAVDQAWQTLVREEKRIRSSLERVVRALADEGVNIDVARTLTITSDFRALEEYRDKTDKEIASAEANVDPEVNGSFANRLAEIEAKRNQLQQESELAASEYQTFLVATAQWREALSILRGEGETPAAESLAGLRSQREDLTITKPALLKELDSERRGKCREIHGALLRLAVVHEDIARPVRQYIEDTKLTREHYRLAFDLRIAESGLADRLFGLITQQSGSFAGVQPGRAILRKLVAEADFSSADGTLEFVDRVIGHLVYDHRHDPPTPVTITDLVRKGATVSQLYDLVYSLEYLRPTFELGLNGKPLRQLSPGERGILLLVFYLVVDLSDEPLIIDQPEGNLNNQSIVDHLVPVIIAAKARRQIIIVTHNPNIAVVCDAEQIVHCEMKEGGTRKICYSSGAIENPKFNKLSLDLLEGTGMALDARVNAYDRSQRTGIVDLPIREWVV